MSCKSWLWNGRILFQSTILHVLLKYCWKIVIPYFQSNWHYMHYMSAADEADCLSLFSLQPNDLYPFVIVPADSNGRFMYVSIGWVLHTVERTFPTLTTPDEFRTLSRRLGFWYVPPPLLNRFCMKNIKMAVRNVYYIFTNIFLRFPKDFFRSHFHNLEAGTGRIYASNWCWNFDFDLCYNKKIYKYVEYVVLNICCCFAALVYCPTLIKSVLLYLFLLYVCSCHIRPKSDFWRNWNICLR